jgi:hypothetical protein
MLYRLDPDLTLRQAFGPVTTSNGIAWSSLLGVRFLWEAPERANGSGRRAGKWGLVSKGLSSAKTSGRYITVSQSVSRPCGSS